MEYKYKMFKVFSKKQFDALKLVFEELDSSYENKCTAQILQPIYSSKFKRNEIMDFFVAIGFLTFCGGFYSLNSECVKLETLENGRY